MTYDQKDLELWNFLRGKLCRPGDAPVERDRGGRFINDRPQQVKVPQREDKRADDTAN